ncbi:hypothetical protein SUGI_0685480 [Cryptomeria japonica]|nr:hypothetical protein SUGI_0685480 [Cryptomeria japonica]
MTSLAVWSDLFLNSRGALLITVVTCKEENPQSFVRSSEMILREGVKLDDDEEESVENGGNMNGGECNLIFRGRHDEDFPEQTMHLHNNMNAIVFSARNEQRKQRYEQPDEWKSI